MSEEIYDDLKVWRKHGALETSGILPHCSAICSCPGVEPNAFVI